MAQTPESALEQYLLLGKRAKGKAAASLVLEALKNPNTYLFGELLDLPGVKELENGEFKKEYDTLCLFAFKTYSDYKVSPDSYIVNEKLLNKLKQLTIVSLSSKQRILPYNLLLTELDIQNVRELEDLLIDCLYQGLINGKLDQKQKHVEVYEAMGRDIKPGEVSHMIKLLKRWEQDAANMIENLQNFSNEALNTVKQNKEQKAVQEKKIEEIKKILKASIESSDGDEMMGGGKKIRNKPR